MEPKTIKELLYWSYANLAMAHAAVTNNDSVYGCTHFCIRSRLYKGLSEKNMTIGQLVEDEKLKLILPQVCCYCGSKEMLSADHLISKKRGGENNGENLIWACRICNSSKGAKDMLEWFNEKGEFPPLLLLRRYLKLAIELCQKKGIMDTELIKAPDLPISLKSIPISYPQPSQLKLWIIKLT